MEEYEKKSDAEAKEEREVPTTVLKELGWNAYMRKYRKSHQEQSRKYSREYMAKWRKEHHDEFIAYQRAYRAKKRALKAARKAELANAINRD